MIKEKFILRCLSKRIKARIYRSTKGNCSIKNWEKLVGFTIKELKEYLEKTMPNGYTWEDYIYGKIVVDHIIPISAFNIKSPNSLDFKRCWALENLQLLTHHENCKKSYLVQEPLQTSLV